MKKELQEDVKKLMLQDVRILQDIIKRFGFPNFNNEEQLKSVLKFYSGTEWSGK